MKSVILLSGGMDSAVNLFAARSSVTLALTFDYGQRAAKHEIASSKKLCELLGITHQLVALDFFRQLGGSSLTDPSQNLPLGEAVSIDDLEVSERTAKSVWVSNRNGVFLNIAAAYAEALGADEVLPGFNIEEAATFSDNSIEFMSAMEKSLSYSTRNRVKVKCVTAQLNKTEIVKLGEELGVPWGLIWPCYQNFEKWCGECESCQRAKRAFLGSGIEFSRTGF